MESHGADELHSCKDKQLSCSFLIWFLIYCYNMQVVWLVVSRHSIFNWLSSVDSKSCFDVVVWIYLSEKLDSLNTQSETYIVIQILELLKTFLVWWASKLVQWLNSLIFNYSVAPFLNIRVFPQIHVFCLLHCYIVIDFWHRFRQMKIATATAMMLENWMRPSVCIKITFLQCKNAVCHSRNNGTWHYLAWGFYLSASWLLCSMDIDYSPTGREFVTGSYDRTVSCPSLIELNSALKSFWTCDNSSVDQGMML